LKASGERDSEHLADVGVDGESASRAGDVQAPLEGRADRAYKMDAVSVAGIDRQARQEFSLRGWRGAPSAAIERPEGALHLVATIAGGRHAAEACGEPGAAGGEHAFAELGEGAVEQAGDVHLGDAEVTRALRRRTCIPKAAVGGNCSHGRSGVSPCW
jgi:hypothetical protein